MRPGRGSGTATVLFTDLVGSTDLMTQVGEAAFDELRRAHFAALRAAIERVGGEEIKNTGDGVMAVFASVADAVHCAVAMQQATDRQSRSGPAPLAIRVGLAVGDVMFEDGDAFGAPVVEAARLVAAAAPGGILTTEIARALAGGRVEAGFVDRGALKLKGLPQPVSVCEVAWEPRPEPSVPMPVLLTDVGRVFVGRDAELGRLEQLWKEAAAGELRLAFLAGEPGVGKTRLAAELAGQVHDEQATVLAGRCDEDLGVPYQPFVEALRHFVDHRATDDLAGRLGRYGGELVRLVPELAERVPDMPSPIRSDPETERYRLFDAVAAWLAVVSAEESLLLVLDDLQWAAKPTLLLLRHIVRVPELKRLLVLGTYRDTELSHDHPLVEVLADLRRQEGVERLSLIGLDSSGVAAFMEQAAGRALADEDLVLARAIHEETEGNPFFVREVFRHLAESGAIERREGQWATRLPVDEMGIPEGVREVVGRRLSRLSVEANQALRAAAVVGAEFEVSVLEAAAGLNEDVLLSALEEATNARLVIEVSSAAIRYRFAHALVRGTLYDQLTSARRAALHRKVAQAIETMHAHQLDDDLPALAHHWARAAVPAAESDRALEYATRAGHRALTQLAHDEAVSYYRQALDLLGAAQGGPPADARRLKLLLDLGEAQRRAGDPAFRATLLDALNLAEQLGDVGAIVRAALVNRRGYLPTVIGDVDDKRVRALELALEHVGPGDTPTHSRLLAALGLELLYTGERERRTALSDAALAMARRAGDPATLAEVLSMRFYTITGPTTAAACCADTSELVEVADRLGDPLLRFVAHILRGRAVIVVGDLDEADRHMAHAGQLAKELGQPPLRWLAETWQVTRATLAGDFDRAAVLGRQAGELGRAAGQTEASAYWVSQDLFIRIHRGGDLAEIAAACLTFVDLMPRLCLPHALLSFVHAEQGERRRAQTLLDAAAADGFSSVSEDSTWTITMCLYSAVAADLGDRSAGAVLRDLLAPHPEQIAAIFPCVLGSISHYLGILSATLGRFEEADDHFAHAAIAHEAMRAPAWLARTRLEWARMLLARRQPADAERARDLLSQGLATARELGLANVERRVVALLQ